MARRKIVPEEEVSKPAMAEETTATDVDDEAPADLMPDSNAEESATSEAVPTETLLEGINGNDAEGSVQAEKSESISAEKASEEAMSVEDASVSEEELPAGSEHADASIEEVTTEPESASDALSEAAILCDADEDGNSVSDMVPQEISELHDEAEEAAEYSVDFSEEPETVSPESTPISSTEESDWGFQEPKKEITEEEELEPPLETPVSVESPKAVPKSDRQLFYELKFNSLDRGLTPEERQEWNSIYASYRGRSAITGTIIGVDPHSIYVWNPETERREKKTMYCAIVVPYDDVYQQLALRLIKAVAGYDPEKGRLEQHIFAQLKYELLSCRSAYRLCGMTGTPHSFRKSHIISIDTLSENSGLYEETLAA